MKYFITGTNGPGFASDEEAAEVLRNIVIPSFQRLIQYEKDGVIQSGGLPVGDRAIVFIVEAESNDALDRILRKLPIWGALDWEVTPLQSFQGRMAIEQDAVRQL